MIFIADHLPPNLMELAKIVKYYFHGLLNVEGEAANLRYSSRIVYKVAQIIACIAEWVRDRCRLSSWHLLGARYSRVRG